MKTNQYCTKCIMKEGVPGVIFSGEEGCNICSQTIEKKEVRKLYKMRYKSAIKKSMDFWENVKKDESYYQCMLMLSGGKDSVYMLNNLINEEKLRVLAYTLNHPFESKQAVHNIEKVINKLDLDHVNFSPNQKWYKRLMKQIFCEDSNNVSIDEVPRLEKMPCIVCTDYIKIHAYVLAYRMKIPYILYCADYMQIPVLESDIKKIIKDIYKFIGKDLVTEIFGNVLEEIIHADDCELPQIIFPYATVNDYSEEKIINELKELDLYESSPRQTHCILYSLLNYYAYKKYGCHYYTVEMAYLVKDGIKDREQTIQALEAYGDIMLNIAIQDEQSDEQKAHVKEVLKSLYESEEEIEEEFKNIFSLIKTMEMLDIKPKDIKCNV